MCCWVLLWNTRRRPWEVSLSIPALERQSLELTSVKYYNRLSVPVAVWLGTQTLADVLITSKEDITWSTQC